MALPSYKFLSKITALPYVEAVYLYGSRARGDNQPRSDIDLAIFCPTATSKEWLDILELVENADTLLKVDCVRFDSLQETDFLKKNILEQRQILYEKREHNGT